MTEATEARIEIQAEDGGPCKKNLSIQVPAECVDQIINTVRDEFSRQASIPGFRKGKIPPAMVENKYRKEILADARKRLLQEALQQGIEENNIKAIGAPEYEGVPEAVARGTAIRYTVSLDTEPELTLIDPATIELTQDEVTVFDEELEGRIDQFLNYFGEFKDVTDGAADSDIVTGDLTVVLDGETLDTQEDQHWQMHGNHAHGPFGSGVKPETFKGKKTGDTVTFEATLKDDHALEQARGKTVTVNVTVKEIKRREKAELNDDFAKRLGAENVDRLRESMRERLVSEIETNINRTSADTVLDQLIEKIPFELPERTLTRLAQLHKRRGLQELIETVRQHHIDEDRMKDAMANLDKDSAESAERSIRRRFIFRKFAEQYELKVEEEEVDEELFRIARSRGQDPVKMMRSLSQDDLVAVADEILLKKVEDYLMGLVKITVQPRKKPELDKKKDDDHDACTEEKDTE